MVEEQILARVPQIKAPTQPADKADRKFEALGLVNGENAHRVIGRGGRRFDFRLFGDDVVEVADKIVESFVGACLKTAGVIIQQMQIGTLLLWSASPSPPAPAKASTVVSR